MEIVDPCKIDRVDPRVRALAENALAQPSFNTMDPYVLRQMTAEGFGKREHPDDEGIERVFDVAVPGDVAASGPGFSIPMRVYVPVGVGPFPVMMYFHGGGWVAGSLDTHDSICRMCCLHSGFMVISVDYRLAPEAKFPAAPEDCYAATCWVVENASAFGGDGSKLVVAGDSAGGNLTAVVCLMARDRKGPLIKHQIIVCGGLQQANWFIPGYLEKEEDGNHPYASPLLAEDLSQLPATTLITAECDPVTPQSVAFAGRLCAAGVETHYYCHKGMLHGFFADKGLEQGIEAVKEVAMAARRAVGIQFPAAESPNG